jgi:hypothetical protein
MTTTTTATTPSNRLYDKACIAAEKANALRFNTKTNGLSAPDELRWYNNNTCWNALSRKEFRDVMIRMEAVTVQFYDDYGDCVYPSREIAIKKFWADEWGCEYLPESGKWLDLASNTQIESETEKKAKKAQAKAQAKAEKKAKKNQKQKQTQNQYNDDEEELYAQALAQTTNTTNTTKSTTQYRDRFDAEEAAYDNAYAVAKSIQAQSQKARLEEEASAREYALAKSVKAQAEAQAQKAAEAQIKQEQQAYDSWCETWDEEEAYAEAYTLQKQKEQKQKQEQKEQKEQKEQEEAQAYLDSLTYEDEDEEEEEEEEEQPAIRIACKPVLYFEELTNVKGDPDWRAYIYYDERTRRYVLKGTRRSLRANGKKTVYPEMQLCFRSSKQLASYLRSSTDNTMNVTMFAMAAATVKDATFGELYALPARGGCKTELFGYDKTRPRYSTFVNYLRMLSDVDASRSNFAAF